MDNIADRVIATVAAVATIATAATVSVVAAVLRTGGTVVPPLRDCLARVPVPLRAWVVDAAAELRPFAAVAQRAGRIMIISAMVTMCVVSCFKIAMSVLGIVVAICMLLWVTWSGAN